MQLALGSHPRAHTARAYHALMPALPREWSPADVDEHHLLVKRLGQVCCRPVRLDCPAYPVRTLCRTGRGSGGPGYH